MAARLYAHRASGGRIELLVLDPSADPVPVLARPARRLKDGEVLTLNHGASATIHRSGDRIAVQFSRPIVEIMEQQGEMPLPPYLERNAEAEDAVRYQTVYAGPLGAAAAPTAGLHFTPALIETLRQIGVGFTTVTLHVGIGTFRPLRAEDLARGSLHEERYHVSEETWEALDRATRIIAVGTTSARTLESARGPGWGTTTLFIKPGYTFSRVHGLITNFHLPKSSLLLLVASLVGRTRLFDAYQHAMDNDYRFYSYGDAMLLI